MKHFLIEKKNGKFPKNFHKHLIILTLQIEPVVGEPQNNNYGLGCCKHFQSFCVPRYGGSKIFYR